ncbi:MAG: SurA N-terminal domain-containing protein [Schleiferiaceae bacterium]|jgi:parvulin-like peptidyl-prolyl isomerase|nr:SurA N-terminal domain-containing protein [Schleiferiaceae bacterium]
MATLEKIRKRSGLLIVVIGLAMGGFVLQDLFSSGRNLFSDPNTIGSINGEKITRQDFALRIENLKNNNEQYAQFSDKMVADFVWNQLQLEIIQGEECEKLGLSVSSEELFFNLKNDPSIRQAPAFQDPNTGQFSESRIGDYLTSLQDGRDNGNPEAIKAWQQWTEYEKAMADQALTTKYNNAVKYGIYIPKAIGEHEYAKTSKSVQAQFIQLPYVGITDADVEPTEGDLSSYYGKNKSDYERKASRDISFVTFPIQPSDADNNEVLTELNEILEDRVDGVDTIAGFRNTDNDSLYVSLNSDYPFADRYVKAGNMNQEIDSLMMNSEVGFVYGPYKDGDGYTISKLNDIINMPDSVKARHVLISFAGAERAAPTVTRTGFEAKALADSLFAIVKDDASQFDSISEKHSDDIAAKMKGGDLGWFSERMMAEPFENYCFRNEKGDIGLVFTNFGFHIIAIDDQAGENKAVRVANIHRAVRPSQTTIEDIYREAAMFAKESQSAEDANALAAEKGLSLRPAKGLSKGDENIPGLNQNRQIVRWAFNEERAEGNVNVFSTNEAHIVVILDKMFEDGVAPLDKVKEEVRAEVLKEKKAEMLMQKFNDAKASGASMENIATTVGAEVKPQATNLGSTALSGVGSEPVVIGTMCGLPANAVSQPIKGNSGVFVVMVQQELPFTPKPDYKAEQDQLSSSIRGLVASQLFTSLKEGADVEEFYNDIY